MSKPLPKGIFPGERENDAGGGDRSVGPVKINRIFEQFHVDGGVSESLSGTLGLD